MPLVLTCHKPQHTVEVETTQNIYTRTATCQLHYSILAMQAHYVSVPLILARREFTLMVMSTLQIIAFGVQRTPVDLWKMVYTTKNRQMVWNFEKKIVELFFLKQQVCLFSGLEQEVCDVRDQMVDGFFGGGCRPAWLNE